MHVSLTKLRVGLKPTAGICSHTLLMLWFDQIIVVDPAECRPIIDKINLTDLDVLYIYFWL